MGDPGGAEDWVRGRGLAPDDEPVYPQDAEYQLLARLLIAEGDPHQAVPMLGPWRALAVAQGRTADVIAVAVLASLAHAANRDDAAAQAALAEALVLAAPEGHLRVFLAEGAPLAVVLRPLLADPRWMLADPAPSGLPREFLTRLAAAFDRQGTPVLPIARPGATTVLGLVEPLSARGAGGVDAGRRGSPEPGHRRAALHQRRHRQAARQPSLRQAATWPSHQRVVVPAPRAAGKPTRPGFPSPPHFGWSVPRALPS